MKQRDARIDQMLSEIASMIEQPNIKRRNILFFIGGLRHRYLDAKIVEQHKQVFNGWNK